MTGPTRLDHVLWCRACGFLGRKRRRREREADERLLVNFHRWVADGVRADRAVARRQIEQMIGPRP